MELSTSHRFIFIHVYRNAGQSITAALEPYLARPRLTFRRLPLVWPLRDWRLQRLREYNYGHISARELRAGLPPEQFERFFKFSFVRNPWSWQVSVFHYIRQRRDHPDHAFFESFRDFDAYLDWRINEARPELQSDFLCDQSGELLVDFVGRHERLAADFGALCERLGIPPQLPHKNGSHHGDFRDYYSPEARVLVEEAYREDIERFGYSFDGREVPPPIVAAHATV
jgi:hypothetical protein